jgi:hypothetical protein
MRDEEWSWLELADFRGSLESIHDGHSKVKQHGVVAPLRSLLNGIQAIVGGVGVMSLELEKSRQHVGGIVIVIDDQDAQAPLRIGFFDGDRRQ